jgi:oligopeptide/dipeptide ABC transporter ATP-binding protein
VMYAGLVVESGPVSRIFNAPVHPYTEALLNSIPRMSDSAQRLTAIEGQPPDLAALPQGCAFAPRCVRAFDRCRVEAPPEFALSERRTARCWLAAGPHPNPPPLPHPDPPPRAGEGKGGGSAGEGMGGGVRSGTA